LAISLQLLDFGLCVSLIGTFAQGQVLATLYAYKGFANG